MHRYSLWINNNMYSIYSTVSIQYNIVHSDYALLNVEVIVFYEMLI